jgi:glycosyltransferase involved in cell wall biosynthesis
MTARTLYICYFGINEALVQTQVLPYLRQLRKDGTQVSLLTFEPGQWTEERAGNKRSELSAGGIDWHFLPYHKKLSVLATSYDILKGASFIRRFARENDVAVLHARSHVPMAMALIANRSLRRSLVFDLRGLMAEEYVDAGVWAEGSPPFAAVKWVEKLGLRKADQIVVLTEKMKRFLVEAGTRESESINVIPCCVDMSRLNSRSDLKRERFELIYAGSVIGLYMLKEMGVFFRALRQSRPNAFFRILTGSDPALVAGVFQDLGIDADDYSVSKADPRDVLNIVRQAHLAISFRKPTFSQIAASPTKIPEYLACGLPVVANDGVGDSTEIIRTDNVGAVVDEFSVEAYRRAIDEIETIMLDKNLERRCIDTASKRFDLETVGGARYRAMYEKILRR